MNTFHNRDRTKILKMYVDVINIDIAVEKIKAFIKNEIGAYVCVSNVHMCMEVFDSSNIRSIVNNSDLTLPDGRPIYWAQQMLGEKSAEQVRGQDLMFRLCAESEINGFSVGLYGGASDAVLSRVENSLLTIFPKLRIVYTCSPPFRELTKEEDNKIISELKLNKVDVLFVGIGCPKQEYWMASHYKRLNCTMLGVGAAFDFISGEKKHAPKVMQKMGIEWLFRLLSEPRRLWKRYCVHNPRFLFYFFLQILFKKKY